MPSTFQVYGAALYKLYCQLEARVVTPESDNHLTKLSASEAAKKIREGELSSYALVKAYFNRIRFVNGFINAVAESFEAEALEEARRVDDYIQKLDKASEEYKNLEITKPLLGVPVSVKSSFDVKGHRTISGLTWRRNLPPVGDDAVAVERIRSAGGIPHCHTNVPDACLWIETFNKVFGTTSSPYDNRTTCGGSSGGEGAIISAEGSVIGIGTDIGGSVRMPAILNGIFSLKPVDDIPLDGHFPGGEGDDLHLMAGVGLLARYAHDLAIFYSALSYIPIPDNYINLKPTKIYTVICISDEHNELSDVIRNAVPKVVNALGEKFEVEVEELEIPKQNKIMEWYFNEINDPKLGTFTGAVFPFDDNVNLIAEKLKSLVGIGQVNPGTVECLQMFNQPRGLQEYTRIHNELLEYRVKINQILSDDVLVVAPSLPRNHYFHRELLFTPRDFFLTGIFNVLALPAAIAPIGLDNQGYPVTVQLAAKRGNDFLLTRTQEHIHDIFGGWKPPKDQL
ncbi:unnamed protein product [Bursaphelenchus xylophilus]|uniref:(pine wood nematode) hypothetical protein n=1 Tax=Bursaphelenchus xylophilus TaxID=6326 RepID=A0A1I7SWV9_BURXY|nr:unnamed protein product [Bursaphelenchus xylophilus]CAG9099991.1 unnamed protein product [Bursaphelenchus xylophilus]